LSLPGWDNETVTQASFDRSGDFTMSYELIIRKPWGQTIRYHSRTIGVLLSIAELHLGIWRIRGSEGLTLASH
jgi:hypothetical protein